MKHVGVGDPRHAIDGTRSGEIEDFPGRNDFEVTDSAVENLCAGSPVVGGGVKAVFCGGKLAMDRATLVEANLVNEIEIAVVGGVNQLGESVILELPKTTTARCHCSSVVTKHISFLASTDEYDAGVVFNQRCDGKRELAAVGQIACSSASGKSSTKPAMFRTM